MHVEAKIHRNSITGVKTTPSNSAIATSVVAWGHQNLNVVAEGARPRKILEFLKPRDCDEHEGFFCSRPVPAYELKGLAINGRPADMDPAAGGQASGGASRRPTHAHHLPNRIEETQRAFLWGC